MPNVFEKIKTTLEEHTAEVYINVQVGQLGAARISLRQFSDNARAELQSFIDSLSGVSLPPDAHAQTLEIFFNELLDTVPEEVSGVSVQLSGKSDAIAENISAAYLEPLSDFFELYRCIDELLLKLEGVGFAGNPEPQDNAPFASASLMLSESLKNSLEELLEALTEIESPLDGVDSLMILLGTLLSFVPREYFSATQSPYIEEIQQLVDTLNEWQSLDAEELAEDIITRLTGQNDFLAECYASMDIEPVITAAEAMATALGEAFEDNDQNLYVQYITQDLDKLTIAIKQGNADDVNEALFGVAGEQIASDDAEDAEDDGLFANTAALEGSFQAISEAVLATEADEQLAAAMEDLLDELEEKMAFLLNQLEPPFELEAVSLFPDTFLAGDIQLDLDNILEAVKKSLDWLCALIQKLNLEAISDTFDNVTGDIQGQLTDWQSSVDDFYDAANTWINDLTNDIENIDTEQITANIIALIEDYREEIQTEVSWVFKKIQKAVDDYVELVEATAGEYSYEDLEASLNGLIQDLSQLLMQYLEMLDGVKAAVDHASDKLKTQSFKTVSDLVVIQIDKTTAGLKAIDPEQMNGGVLLGLTAALEVLPTEELLRKQMDQLQDELDELIEEGPIALIEQYKDKPAEILEEIKQHIPVEQIKIKLGELYAQLVDKLEEFEPGQLFDPLAAQLLEIDAAIAAADNPCKGLDSVVALYEKLLDMLDSWDSNEVIQFLEEQKAKIADAVGGITPEPYIDKIIKVLEDIEGAPEKLKALMEKVVALTEDFDDPEQQLDDWLELLYEKIDELDNVPSFDDEIAALTEQAQATTEEFINGEDGEGFPIKVKLAHLVGLMQIYEPQDQLTNLLLAYNNLQVAVADHSPLPEEYQENVHDFMEAFGPFKTTVEADLTAFEGVRDKLEEYKERLTKWETLFFGPHSPLRHCLPTEENIKAMLKECIETQLKPRLLALLSVLPQVKTLAEEVQALIVGFIDDCVPDIAGLRTGLESVEASVGLIKGEVEDLDLSPAYNLEELYQTAKGQLEGLDVAGIQTAVCDAFDALRESLKLSELLSEDDVQSLDKSYANLLEVANAFDPEAWIEEELKPELERLLEPYLDSFSLTQFFELLLERMKVLKKELRKELDRIYEEFVEMLEAVPRLESPASLTLQT